MKKSRTLLVLLLCLVVLVGGYFAARAFSKNEEKKEAEAENKDVIAINKFEDPADVLTMAVETADGSYSLTYDDGWKGTVDVDLDQLLCDQAAILYSDVAAQMTITEGTAADYHLDDPEMTVTITLVDGSSTVYYFGMENPVTHTYYFRMDGDDTIYMVKGDYYDTFCDGIVSFAQVETMPDLTASDVTGVTVAFNEEVGKKEQHFVCYPDTSKAPIYTFAESWFFDAPEVGLVTMDSVSFGQNLTGLTGLELYKPVFVATKETIKEAGLDDPYVTSAFTYAPAEGQEGKGGEVTVLVSNKCDRENQMYVMLKGGQYIYRMGESAISPAYSFTPSEYITPIALPVDQYSIESVDIIIGAKTYTVEFSEQAADVANAHSSNMYYYYNGEMMDEDKAYNWRLFFNKLRAQYADQITLTPNEFDDSKPVATVVVHRDADDGFDTLTLSFYPYDASFYISDFNGLRIQLFDKNFIQNWVKDIDNVLY